VRLIHQLTRIEQLNFLLTNRIPRRWATLFMGWFSRLRHPWIRRPSIAIWQFFAGDLNLEEARKSRFDSMHDCFIRQLKPGARPLAPDPETLVSPCDGMVGAMGAIEGTRAYQIKGMPYSLEELLGDPALAARYRNGHYITLRLKASMYHRFHAPDHCRLRRIHHISGDTWNVNPIALKRVERLFCRNERAVLELETEDGLPFLLVPVAAILVASLRLHALPRPLGLRYQGPARIDCNHRYHRGEELGYFEQGSTVIVIAPPELAPDSEVAQGNELRMGQALLRRARSQERGSGDLLPGP